MSAADAVTALTRFGLGARQGDVATITSDPRGAVRAEIAERDAALLDDAGLPDAVTALTAIRTIQQQRRANRKPDAEADTAMTDAEPMQAETPVATGKKRKQGDTAMVTAAPMEKAANPLRDELAARLVRAGDASIGFAERLTAFWANHFAIASSNQVVRWLSGPFEREAIRPFVLGSFSDMLMAASRHPAMLSYLNNATSIGPNSKAGMARGKGLNENHAREILELHTLGVDGGYTQADVTAFANILTGWSFGQNPKQAKNFGAFTFRAAAHEPGVQAVLGVSYSEKGMAQGEAVFAVLAAHPATARHIATKLARHFVADVPPEPLVAALSQVFLDSGGDLQAVAAALIDSDAVWAAPPTKIRSPQDFIWASVRALGISPEPPIVIKALTDLGQPLWNPPSPAGFADTTATWLAPDAMTNRLDIAQLLAQRAGAGVDPRQVAADVLGPRLSDNTKTTIERAESPLQGLSLLLMSPEFLRR
jgi:uncharacterized protein (DUF1800 family)